MSSHLFLSRTKTAESHKGFCLKRPESLLPDEAKVALWPAFPLRRDAGGGVGVFGSSVIENLFTGGLGRI
jgi:hypothetical protein